MNVWANFGMPNRASRTQPDFERKHHLLCLLQPVVLCLLRCTVGTYKWVRCHANVAHCIMMIWP